MTTFTDEAVEAAAKALLPFFGIATPQMRAKARIRARAALTAAAAVMAKEP